MSVVFQLAHHSNRLLRDSNEMCLLSQKSCSASQKSEDGETFPRKRLCQRLCEIVSASTDILVLQGGDRRKRVSHARIVEAPNLAVLLCREGVAKLGREEKVLGS